MACADKQGITNQDHFLQIEKNLQCECPELELPCYPFNMDYIYVWFRALHASRQRTDSGPCPLSFADIMSWVILMRVEITSWEVEAIRGVDAIFLKIFAENQDRNRGA